MDHDDLLNALARGELGSQNQSVVSGAQRTQAQHEQRLQTRNRSGGDQIAMPSATSYRDIRPRSPPYGASYGAIDPSSLFSHTGSTPSFGQFRPRTLPYGAPYGAQVDDPSSFSHVTPTSLSNLPSVKATDFNLTGPEQVGSPHASAQNQHNEMQFEVYTVAQGPPPTFGHGKKRRRKRTTSTEGDLSGHTRASSREESIEPIARSHIIKPGDQGQAPKQLRLPREIVEKNGEKFARVNGDLEQVVYHQDIRRRLLREADAQGSFEIAPTGSRDEEDRTSYLASQRSWGGEDARRPQETFLFDAAGITEPSYPPEFWYWRGRLVLDAEDRGIINWHHLPLTISSQVEGWRILAWHRVDSRIVMQDLASRMPNKNRPKPAALTLRETRFREPNRLYSWTRKKWNQAHREILWEAMPESNRQSNSTRGLPRLEKAEVKEIQKRVRQAVPNQRDPATYQHLRQRRRVTSNVEVVENAEDESLAEERADEGEEDDNDDV